MFRPSHYPDIADILAKKAKGRCDAAARTFVEKLAALDRMHQNVRPIRDARRSRAVDPRARKCSDMGQS